jgi:integrase
MKTTQNSAWTKTNVPNLYRHLNRRYYARLFVGGKEIWKSLKTNLKSVAEERLTEHVANARQQRASGIKLASGAFTFADVIALYRQNFHRDAEIADGTKNFREAGIKRVLKTWPGVGELNVRKITATMVREWALKLRAEAMPYVPRGAKRPSRASTGVSPTTFNCALDAMRQALDLAVEAGHLFTNPARDRSIKRATPKLKRLVLPSREQFRAVVEAIESAGAGECRAAAEMVRFLAYTGARQTEANNVQWGDVDFANGRITLRVTKNGDPRDVPMIPECRALLEGMRQVRSAELSTEAVLRVRECRGFLERACNQVGAPRVGHHGLRHLFATTSIEAGIDVPTVARIMGHRDGGALAMKVYGHLRDEHAQAAMQKVNFGAKPAPANVVEFKQAIGENSVTAEAGSLPGDHGLKVLLNP